MWVIDPIDGTVNFSSSFPIYGHSIALMEEHETTFGLIYLPQMNKLYYAEKGVGAFCNNKQIKCSKKNELGDSVISIMLTSHYSKEENKKAVSIIGKYNMLTRGVRVIVCIAAELGFISEGILDGSISIKADLYGAAAGMLLLREAGGKITDLNGSNFGENSSSLVASNGNIHSFLFGK